MLSVLRIIGISNAALWFGSSLLFLISIRTGFQSVAMTELLPGPFAEAAMHLIMAKYLNVVVACSLIAVIQLWAEQWYRGRPIFRLRLSILLSLIGLSLILKWAVFPAMKKQHLRAHKPSATAEDQQTGARAYRTWKTGFYFIHLIVLGGAFSHLMYISQGQSDYRVVGVQQFRG